MGHALRTSLSGIVGLCELLVNTELSVKQIEYVAMLRESADSLLRTVEDILGIQSPPDVIHDAKIVPLQLNRTPLRVLVVDNSDVNRLVAMRQLEMRGHNATPALNGEQAVELLKQGGPSPFDVVLMDVHMLQMDGLQAAAQIRAYEKGVGRHTPIIAMTSGGHNIDSDNCVACGMDGLLGKPIYTDELFLAVEKYSPTTPAVDLAPNRESVLLHVGGSVELLREIADLFTQETPKLISRMKQAVATGNSRELFVAAHTFKGSSALFKIHPLVEISGRLEDLGRKGKINSAPELLKELEREYERCLPVIRELSGR